MQSASGADPSRRGYCVIGSNLAPEAGMSVESLAVWARMHLAAPLDVDCTTTVMLKILDGKCKMGPHDKDVIPVLYEAIRDLPGGLLGEEAHALIRRACSGERELLVGEIYEYRVLAETAISRPAMKAYKARLRTAGILGGGE